MNKTRSRMMKLCAWIVAAVVAAAMPTQAATYFWDGASISGNGNGVSDPAAAGNWNTGSVNWDQGNGLPRIAWPNLTSDTAEFAGTARTVTIGTVNTGTLNVKTSAYIFQTGSITFSSGVIDVNTAGNVQFTTALLAGSVTYKATGNTTTTANGGGIGQIQGNSTGLTSFELNANAANQLYAVNAGAFGPNNATLKVTKGILGLSATAGTIYNAWNTQWAGGTLRLRATGSSTFSGNGTLTADTDFVAIASSILVYSGNIELGGNTLTLAPDTTTGGVTLNGIVSGSGNLTIKAGSVTGNGLGTVTLGAANTFSGTAATTANLGSLVLSNVDALKNATLDTGNSGTQSVLFTVAGNNTYNIGALSGGDDLAVGGNTLSIGSKAANTTYSGTISGSGGGLIKVGSSSTLTLSGANTYTGGTTIGDGVLSVNTIKDGAPSSLGSVSAAAGTITINGGTLQYVGTGDTSSRVIDISGGNGYSTVDASGSGSLTLNGNVVGSHSLWLTGTGTGTAGGTISTGGGSTLYKTGAGTWFLSGKTSSPNINIREGALAMSGSGTLSGSAALAMGGGSLDLGGTSQTVGAVTITAAASSGDTVANGSLTGSSYAASLDTGNAIISAKLRGAVAFTKTGAGTVTLSGANTYTGGTAVNEGALVISGSGQLGSSASLAMGGGRLDLGGTSQTVGAVTITAAASSGDTVANGSLTGTSYAASMTTGNAIISAKLRGAVAFTKTGAGTVTLSGANTYSGTTTINLGTVQYTGSGSNSGGGSYVIVNGTGDPVGANLTLNTSGSVTASGLNFASHSNEYLYLTAGTLTIGSGGITYDGAYITGGIQFGGGALKSSAAFNIEAGIPIDFDGGTSVIDTTGGNITSSSAFLVGAGAGNLTVQGGNTLTLPVSNTYSGNTLITGNSTLTLGTSTLSGLVTVDSGSRFNMNNAAQSIGGLAGAGNVVNNGASARTLTITGAGGNSFSGTLSASTPANLAVTINLSSGGQTFSGANTYGGGTTLSAGVLSVGAISALGSSAGTLTVNGGTLMLNTYSITVGSFGGVGGTVDLGSGAVTATPASGSQTYSGAIVGTGSLTKAGAGSLTLAGANEYTGGTTLNAGVLIAGHQNALGTSGTINFAGGTLAASGGGFTLGNGGTLNFTGDAAFGQTAGATGTLTLTGAGTLLPIGHTLTVNNATTLSGAISGAGSITKAGAGTLTLSGNNTYTGATTVSAGRLVMNGNNSAATGATSVSSTLQLGHLRALAGSSSVDLNSGSTLALRADTSGTFTIGGFAAGPSGTLNFDVDRLFAGSNSTLGLSSGLPNTLSDLQINATGANGYTLYLPSASEGGDSNTLTLNPTSGDLFIENIISTKPTGGSQVSYLRFIGTGTTTVGATGISTGPRSFTFKFNQTGTVILNGPAGANSHNFVDCEITSGTLIFKNTNVAGIRIDTLGGGSSAPILDNQHASGSTINLPDVAFTLAGNFSFGSNNTTGDLDLGTGGITLSGNRTITVNSTTGNLKAPGAIGGGYGLTKAGTGTFILSGANTYTGTTTVNGGTLRFDAIPTGIGAAVVNSLGTLYLNVTGDWSGNLSSITGTGSLTLKTNGGTMSTPTVSGFNGTAEILSAGGTSGRLLVDSAGRALPAGATLIVDSGATAWFEVNDDVPIQVSGTGNSDGLGALRLTGATLGGAVTLMANSSIGANGTDMGTISGTIGQNAGQSSLTKVGTGMIVLSGNNTYSGVTTISAGVLSVSALANGGAASNLGSSSSAAGNLIFDGGTLQHTGASASTDRAFTINTGQTATFDIANGLTISGATGAATTGAMTKTGTGKLTLNGANTYTGATTISAGALQIGAGGTTGSLSASSTITDNATLVFNRSNTITQTADFGTITGAGQVIQNGGGTVVLSSVNGYTGGTYINNGVVSINADSQIGGTSGSITLNGGTLRIPNITLVSTRTLYVGSNGGTISGPYSGATANVYSAISGAGNTLVINPNGQTVNMAGGTSLNLGTLSFAGTGSIYLDNNASITSGITVGSSQTVNLSNSAGSSLSYTFSGFGVTLNGGTLRSRFGANTFDNTIALTGTGVIVNRSGSTASLTINSGMLALAGNALTVQSDLATEYVSILGGITGTSASSLTLDRSASGTTGQLRLSGDNSGFNGNAAITIGEIQIGSSTALSSGNTVTFNSNANTKTFTLNGNNLTIGGLATGATVGTSLVQNANATPVTLTVNLVSGNNTFAGVFQDGGAGTLSLIKDGSGMLTLSGTSTFSGGATLTAGQLNIDYGGVSSANSAIGTGTFTIAGGVIDNTSAGDVTLLSNNTITWTGDFTYAGSIHNLNVGTGTVAMSGSRTATITANALTIGGSITGTGAALTKAGGGTLILAGNNTYNGGTTLNAGVLSVGSTAALGNSAGTLTVSGGTLMLNTYSITVGSFGGGGGTVNLGSGTLTTTMPTSSSQTFSGAIIGSGGLKKTGAGTLSLAGANTYSGTTTINQGVIQYTGSGGNSVGGPISLAYSGGQSIPLQFALNTSGEVKASGVTFEAGHSQTEILNLASGALTIASTGMTVTSGAANYLVDFNGGTLKSSAAFNIAASIPVKLNTGTSVIDTTGGNITSSSPFLVGTGAGSLTVQGGNTLTLPASNTYTGNTLITGNSTLTLGASTLPGVVTVNSGSKFNMNNASQSIGGMAGGGTVVNSSSSGSRTLTITGTGSNDFSGKIDPAAGDQANTSVAINLAGISNVQTFSGANTYGGSTAINAGVLALSGSGKLGSSAALAMGGGRLDLGGTSQTVGAVTITAAASSGDTVVNGSITATSYDASLTTGSATISANLLGAAVFIKTGAGSVTLSGANTYSGGTTVNNGVLYLNHVGGPAIKGDATISGSASGALRGRLYLQADNQLEATAIVSMSSGSACYADFVLGGYSQTIAGFSASGVGVQYIENFFGASHGTGTLTFDLSNASTLTSDVQVRDGSTGSGALVVVKDGTGALTAGAGSIGNTGGWILKNGTLKLSGNGFGASTPVTLQGGTLSSDNTSARSISGNVTFAGNVILGNAVNTGTLTLQTGTATIIGVTPQFTVKSQVIISQNINGSGYGIIKAGSGKLTLSGSNSYTGTTDVQNGTLQLAGSLLSSAALNLGNGSNSGKFVLGGGSPVSQTIAALTVTGTGTDNAIVGGNASVSTLTYNLAGDAGTFSGVLGGIGANENKLAIIKGGTGTWALTGANTYSGGTTVSAGTLLAKNTSGSATGTGTLTVNSGAKLAGTGTISGAATISSGGTLSPGDAGVPGTLTIGGTLTFEAGSHCVIRLVSSANHDMIVAGGLVPNGGTLTLDTSAYNSSATSGILWLFNNTDASGTVSSAFNGYPEGANVPLPEGVWQMTYKANYPSSPSGGNDAALIPATGTIYTFQ